MSNNQSRIDNSLRNMATGFLGHFLTTFLAYVTRIFLVRYLTAEYLGINGLFSSLLSMLSLAELGVGNAIGFALYKPLAQKDEQKITSLMYFYKKAYQIIGVVVFVVGLFMLPFIDLVVQNPPDIEENLYVLYLFFLFNTAISYFFSYKGTLLVAAQKNYITALISYIVTIVQHIIQIVVLVVARDFMLYLLVKTIGVVANNLLIARAADRGFPYIRNKAVVPLSKEEKKTFFINVKALTVNKLCTILVNNTDNIVITYLNGLVVTGIASNYILLSDTLTSLVNQIFSSMTASIGNLNAGDDNEKKHTFFQTLSFSNFWLYSWAAIGITFVSTDLVHLCFGKEYILDPLIPFVLGLNLYISGLNNSVYTYKSTLGLFRYGQYLLLFTALINLVLDFVLGKAWGLFGIYFATLVARLTTNAWFEPYVIYKHGFHKSAWIYFRTYLKYGIVFGFVLGLCYVACGLCKFHLVGNVIAKVLICTVIPHLIYWVCFRKTAEFGYLMELVLRILKKLGNWLPARR